MIKKVRFALYLESRKIKIVLEDMRHYFREVTFPGKWGVWN